MAWLKVLHEDADLLVVHKPAGLVCHPTKGDAGSSLIGRVRLHLGLDAEPQMVHRLDRETSGVMVFGKSDAASAELRRLWLAGLVTKEYLAIVHGHPAQAEGIHDGALGPHPASAVSIRDAVRPDGAWARTRWRVEQRIQRVEGDFALVRVWMDSGRKHQIRIHLSDLGHPLVGDKIYGWDERFYLDFVQRRLGPADKARLLLPNQALHAFRLWLPWAGREEGFESPPEPLFRAFMKGEQIPWEADPYDPARPSLPEASVPGLDTAGGLA